MVIVIIELSLSHLPNNRPTSPLVVRFVWKKILNGIDSIVDGSVKPFPELLRDTA